MPSGLRPLGQGAMRPNPRRYSRSCFVTNAKSYFPRPNDSQGCSRKDSFAFNIGRKRARIRRLFGTDCYRQRKLAAVAMQHRQVKFPIE